MPDKSQQAAVFDVRQFIPQPYPDDSLYALLERYGHLIIREDDFPPPAGPGQRPHDPVMLSKLVLLMAKNGWTEREAARRTEFDLQVKACLGLGIDQRGPSQSTVCRHRARMKRLGLDVAYLDRMVKLLQRLELIQRDEALLADSTPLSGAGQVLDTFNLLAAGIRRGLRALAELRGMTRRELATELSLERYLARSVKGAFDVDWTDAKQRCAVLETLVDDAERLRRAARVFDPPDEPPPSSGGSTGGTPNPAGSGRRRRKRRGKAKAVAELVAALALLDQIADHDVRRDTKGRVTGVRQRAAGDRPISATDVDMRHGRKSASVVIAGYKAHIAATAGYGFIVATRVTPANVHDHQPLHGLVRQGRRRGLQPPWVAADRAYGTLANHAAFAADGRTELVARIIRPHNSGRFTCDDFIVDLDARTASCPAGETAVARWATSHGQRGLRFTFSATACDACPMRAQCTNARAGRGRNVFVVPEARRLIEARLARQAEPEFAERIAGRPVIERVIAGFAQCGGKQARRFGLDEVQFDANLSALAYNLRRFAAISASDAALRARLLAFVCLMFIALFDYARRVRRW